MPSELDERQYYDGHFAELHRRLDGIRDDIGALPRENATQHANDARITAILDGNGKPPLAARLALLESAEPEKEKRSTRLMSIIAIIMSALLVAVDALAAIFRK